MPSGYTVIVKPGIYNESVEPKRDGFPDAQVVIQVSSPGSVTIAPPSATNGFSISYHHHVVDGFVVPAVIDRLKMGPHDPGGTGPVGDRGKGNGGNGIFIHDDVGNGTPDPVELDSNIFRSNTLNGILIVPGATGATGHELKKNSSGGSGSEANGRCAFSVVAGNFNAKDNKANGQTVTPNTDGAAFPSVPIPTGCVP